MIKDKIGYSILLVEDNPGDRLLVEEFVKEQIAFPVISIAKNFADAHNALNQSVNAFDIILLDLTLPDKQGVELINEMLLIAPLCPIIILTGFSDIDFSISSIAKGVIDYIIKDELNAGMLYKSMVHAIERKKMILALIESEKRYSDLFHLSPQPMCLYDTVSYNFIDVNQSGVLQYGYSYTEFLSMSLFDIVPKEDKAKIMVGISNQKRKLNETYSGTFKNIKKSGELIDVETFSTPLFINERMATFVIANDVTEKNLYEHRITKAIIKTQEDERYEIGGELHDNVCQILATSLMLLGMLKKNITSESSALLDQCKDYINMAAVEIRNLSHQLAPAFFDDSSLEDAFTTLLANFNSEGKYIINFHYDQSMTNHILPLDLQLNLYRIVQEQLKNIHKYSCATTIELDLLIFNKKIKMRTSDDGVGFDMTSIRKGIGLANMKRRAELFSGSIDLDATVSQGCTITVDIPVLP